MPERFYERYAWIIFLLIGLQGGFFVPGVIEGSPFSGNIERFAGTTWSQFAASNPTIAAYWSLQFRGWALLLTMAFVLIIAISVKSYRRGEKWAWYAFWSIPTAFVFSIAVALLPEYSIADLATGEIRILLPNLIISLLGLLLPYRKFFPKK